MTMRYDDLSFRYKLGSELEKSPVMGLLFSDVENVVGSCTHCTYCAKYYVSIAFVEPD